jgi:hypothetical protein
VLAGHVREAGMVRAVVGGRSFVFSKEEIEHRTRGVHPEPIREHLVEVRDTAYPPKQVLAAVTGWDRTSFTTMEAQRVLTRVGFAAVGPARMTGPVAAGSWTSQQTATRDPWLAPRT